MDVCLTRKDRDDYENSVGSYGTETVSSNMKEPVK